MLIDQPADRELNAEKAEVITAFLTGQDLAFDRLVSVGGVLFCDRVPVAARDTGNVIVNDEFLTGQRRRTDLVEAVEALARLCGKPVTYNPIRVAAPQLTLAPRARELPIAA